MNRSDEFPVSSMRPEVPCRWLSGRDRPILKRSVLGRLFSGAVVLIGVVSVLHSGDGLIFAVERLFGGY
jgi:hypothetical protein